MIELSLQSTSPPWRSGSWKSPPSNHVAGFSGDQIPSCSYQGTTMSHPSRITKILLLLRKFQEFWSSLPGTGDKDQIYSFSYHSSLEGFLCRERRWLMNKIVITQSRFWEVLHYETLKRKRLISFWRTYERKEPKSKWEKAAPLGGHWEGHLVEAAVKDRIHSGTRE